jgi:hypothetical protein
VKQSRCMSLAESIANVGIGFAVNWICNLIVLPAFGFHVTATSAFQIGLIFTAVSILRSYIMRRLFVRIGQ